MNKRKCLALFFMLVLGFFWSMPTQALEVPYLSGRVVDQAGLISNEARMRIEARLADLEKQTSSQMAILIIFSLEGEDLESYALRVVEEWKLGQKGKDNGILLLIALQDRKMRMEVGYGLEGVIPDALARRVLDQVLAPRFQRKEFDSGLETAVEATRSLILKEAHHPLSSRTDKNWMVQKPGFFDVSLLFLLLPFWVLLMLFFLRVLRRRGQGFSSWSSGSGWFPGGMSGGGSWGGGFSGGGGGFGGGGASGRW